jgi:hypothetical protein
MHARRGGSCALIGAGGEHAAIFDIEPPPTLSRRSLQPLNDMQEVKRGARCGRDRDRDGCEHCGFVSISLRLSRMKAKGRRGIPLGSVQFLTMLVVLRLSGSADMVSGDWRKQREDEHKLGADMAGDKVLWYRGFFWLDLLRHSRKLGFSGWREL